MPRLLDRMPFPPRPGEIAFRGERVRVRADQIIVWVSLSLRRLAEQNPSVVPFPAILDTGHNHTFSISEHHLVRWTGHRPEMFEARSAVRDRGRRVLLRIANVWVHPNASGQRERLTNSPPFLLRARTGIAVYPGGDFPRLPLLGLRVIGENNLILKLDGVRREATLRTPIRWWPFG